MDAFQRGFSRGIPLEKAAAFFVGMKSWQQPSANSLSLMKQAAAKVVETPLSRFRKLAAADEEPVQDGAAMATPTPDSVPEQGGYLASEAAGLEAENSSAVQYYQSLLEQLRGETAEATQRAEQAEQQAQQLEAAQAEHDSQLAAAQQEGQIAQQAAMQQVQSANMAASTAMQQAVDAENRALQAKTTETSAKIQQQQLRSTLLDLAAQGLPGTEPELGGEGNAAEGVVPEQAPQAAAAGAPADGAPPGAEGGQEATAAATPGAGGLNQQGQPANAEGMPGQEASTEAAGAALPGTQPQPAGDSSGGSGAGSGAGPQSNTDGQPAQPEQDPTAKRQGQVSIKVGNASLVALLDRLEASGCLPLARGR